MNYLKISLLFAFAAFSMGGCIYVNTNGGCNKEVKKPFEMAAECTSGKILACNTQFGDIDVTGGNNGECEIKGQIIAKAKTTERAQDLLDNTEVIKEIKGDKIILKPKCNIKKSDKETIGASFVISIASDTTLDLDTSFGDITIVDITKNCKANTSFGDITSKNCTGEPDLDTSFGDVTVEKLTCKSAKVNTSFGDIKLAGCHLPEDFHCNLNTSYGDIKINELDNFAGSVKLSTSFGDVKCDRPITISGSIKKDNVKGTIGNGTGSITANTSFGDIRLQ